MIFNKKYIINLWIAFLAIFELSAQENSIPVSNFDSGILTEQGGFYRSKYSEKSGLKFFLSKAVFRGKNGQSLKIVSDKVQKENSIFLVNLFDEEKNESQRDYLDIANHEILSFWVKGKNGGERFSVQIINDIQFASEYSLEGKSIASLLNGKITTDWQQVLVPYNEFNLSNNSPAQILFHFDGSDEGTVYLDDIHFIKSTSSVHPETSPEITISDHAGKLNEQKDTCPILKVWDFDHGILTNQKGFYNHFQSEPSMVKLKLTNEIVRGNGGRSMQIDYDRASAGFCGAWFHLFDDEATADTRKFIDTSKHPYLSFWVKGTTGEENFSIQMADPIWLGKEDSKAAGLVTRYTGGQVGTSWKEVVVPYQDFKLSGNKATCFVINFTEQQKGTVYIEDINFKGSANCNVPITDISKETTTENRKMRRAMWVWNTKKLLFQKPARKEFYSFCNKYGVNEIFLQLPYEFKNDLTDDVECIILHIEELRNFISESHDHGIRIHALDGYPEFVLTEHHPRVLSQIKSIVDFNNQSAPQQRYDGIHLDNEPYQLLGFDGPEAIPILRQFLVLNQKIMKYLNSQNSEMVYGIDIPFWFDEAKNEDGSLKYVLTYNGSTKDVAKHLIDIVDNIGIMNYRNFAGGADGIIRHGQGEIEYADSVGKNLYLGVETFKYELTGVSFIYSDYSGKINEYSDARTSNAFSRFEQFPIRVLNASNKRYLGLVQPTSSNSWPDFEEALREFYGVFGSKINGLMKDLEDLEFSARTIINDDPRYTGFKPFRLQYSSSDNEEVIGFETTEKMLSKITFAGKSKMEMEEVLEEAKNYFVHSKSFLGFAIHYYDTYLAMP